jgi:hypothetical protein
VQCSAVQHREGDYAIAEARSNRIHSYQLCHCRRGEERGLTWRCG